MKRGRKVALSIALGIWIILLIATFYYLYGVYSTISQDIPAISAYEHQKIEPNGEPFLLNNGDIVSIEFGDSDYSFKMYEVSPSNAEFVVNNFLYFSLKPSKEKKLDLNGDNVYDVIITANELRQTQASIAIELTNERQSIGGDVVETIDRFEKNSQLQTNTMMLVMLITLLVLIFYIIKAFIIPKVEEKKKLSRKTELETFDELYNSFMESNKKDKAKAKKIYGKAKHLYRYMSAEDKKAAESSFEKMTNYLK